MSIIIYYVYLHINKYIFFIIINNFDNFFINFNILIIKLLYKDKCVKLKAYYVLFARIKNNSNNNDNDDDPQF